MLHPVCAGDSDIGGILTPDQHPETTGYLTVVQAVRYINHQEETMLPLCSPMTP